MYLKRIDLQGFKSFANKTSFEFLDGITGIVGPNGSGKSNVADAVRWVLGEQSAKQLRGGNMQDVIFAGTETRKPVSYASVTITFDNHDRALDLDFEEVTVARRLYRSGESEYLLNGNTVRLRDVHELFYDTGIGKEGYSIIGQGQIDRIISGRPEERRELFDEAAGIVKFKRRKVASLKKLAEEEQNLLRVNDILSELRVQVGPLEKQAQVAREYLEKRDRLKELEVNLFLLDDEQLAVELEELEGKIKLAEEETAAVQAKLTASRERYESLDQEMAAQDDKIRQMQEAQTQATLKRQEMSAQIDLLQEQIKTIEQNNEHFAGRKEALAADIEKHRAEIGKFEESHALVLSKVAEKEEAQEKQNALLLSLTEEVDQINEQIAKNKTSLIDLLNARSDVSARMERYDTMLEQINIRKAEISARLLRFTEEENEAKNLSLSAAKELEETKAAIQEAESKLQETERGIFSLSDEIHAGNDALDEMQTTYHSKASRLESLRAIAENYEGYSAGVRKIMEQKEAHPGILGVVADLIATEERYETAIETALGGTLRNVVTEDEASAKEMISYLRENKLGRATFLPLVNVKAREAFQPAEATGEEGVIALASDVVSSDEKYHALVSQLLGRTLLVDTIDHALSIARKYKHKLYIVTLRGEYMTPGGSISGGAYKNQDHLLGRKREIDELTNEVAALEEKQKELSDDIIKKRAKRNVLRDTEVALNEEIQKLRIRENTATISKQQAEEQMRAHKENRDSLDRENDEIASQIAQVNESSGEITEELEASAKKESDLLQEAEALEEKINTLTERLSTENNALSDIQLALATIKQEQSFQDTNLTRIREELAQLVAEDEVLTRDADSGVKDIEDKTAAIEELRRGIEQKEADVLSFAAKVEENTKIRQEMNDQHRDFFTERDTLTEELTNLDKESFRLHQRKEKAEENLEREVNHLWEAYEITPSEARNMKREDLTDRQEMRRESSQLREGIRRLGNVNVNAIEDYKNVSERYKFLSEQHDDLVKSAKTLEDIIASLDRGMRKQFNEKFAQINEEFNKAFQLLFGGGHGALTIDENSDVLEAAISIVAEPPGKKLQNIMQLSGGEKALTAIALLFAIQNLKPSPFCLLDEIEAALDDNNVTRFADYLAKLTKNTQFIIITHRRGTMASADRLYGITMQEKGVSTLVSVNLIENELTA